MKGKKVGVIIVLLAAAAFALSACGKDGSSGSTGATGPTGPPGPSGSAVTNINAQSAETLETATFSGAVTGVSITSPPVVNFWVKDSNGYGVVGLGTLQSGSATNLNYLRFAIAKLVPGTSGSPDQWVSYMVTATSRPTSERVAANLVDHGDGTYTYTFAKNITDSTVTGGVTYEPTLTHRLVIQFSGEIPGSSPSIAIANSLNIINDFVPAGGAVTTKREITTTAACNDCHTQIGVSTPHGGRVQTGYCVVCHTDQRRIGRTNVASVSGAYNVATSQYIADGVVLGDFVPMVHKIHMGNKLTKTGYNYADVLFNDIGYPQDQSNCRKCHTASTAAPQGDNWKNKPSRLACGACHDRVDFATGTNHGLGGIRTNDAACYVCHDAANIELNHITDNATPNNPGVPARAVNFTYEISSVTATANQAVVKFRIKADGTPVTFNTYAAGATLLTGFTGSPSFLVAYADGTDTSVDYNNKSKAAAQPASVSITNIWNGTQGTLSARDADGYYTATIGTATYTTANFPVGAKMRAVALQGYFTQVSPAVARHTVSVIKEITGDTVRREVVDSAKCAKCHEWFEGHGGNRVYTVAVCVTCHNPNLSTSGRGANIANMTTAEMAKANADGFATAVATDVLNFPEASNNMKDMIHGIHASHARTDAFKFVRDRGTSGVFYYNWGHVTYPAVLNNCETCHKPGTYASIPSGVLPTTNVTTGVNGATYNWSTGQVTGGEAAVADVATARGGAALPGNYNLVISPFTSTCVFCHDSAPARAHMTGNGGQINVARNALVAGAEQCVICHGSGRSADVAVVHK